MIDAELKALNEIGGGVRRFNTACDKCPKLKPAGDTQYRQFRADVEMVTRGLNRYKKAVDMCKDVLDGIDANSGENVRSDFAGNDSRHPDSAYGDS